VRVLAAAAVLLVAALGAGVLGRATARADMHTARTAEIVRGDGQVAGHIRLISKPRPMVLVTIDAPRHFDGRVRCSLVGPDWRSVEIGTWSADDVAGGAWAVGIDAAQLNSVRMNVLDANGGILATADLTHA
jgi:hypothetical protein